MAAVAAPSEAEALKQMSILAPRVAQLEELVLVLNPLYADHRAAAEELLVRMQYRFVNKTRQTLDHDGATGLLEDRFDPQSREGKRLIQCFTEAEEVHLYHLSKVAGDREVRAIFGQTEATVEDHLYPSGVITNAGGPLLPRCMPYLFLLMDSEVMFERALELVYGKSQAAFSRISFFKGEDIETGP